MWWRGYASTRALLIIAIILLSMSATSAAVERTNKEFGLQKSKLRNRLTENRAADLTYISYNVKVTQQATTVKKSKKNDHFVFRRNESFIPVKRRASVVHSEIEDTSDSEKDESDDDGQDELEDADNDLTTRVPGVLLLLLELWCKADGSGPIRFLSEKSQKTKEKNMQCPSLK